MNDVMSAFNYSAHISCSLFIWAPLRIRLLPASSQNKSSIMILLTHVVLNFLGGLTFPYINQPTI